MRKPFLFPKSNLLFGKIKIPAALTITLLCIACSSSTYKPITEGQVPTEMDNRTKKMVVVSNEYLNRAGYFTDLINTRKWSRFDTEIQMVIDAKPKAFLKAVRYMAEFRYNEALQSLTPLDPSDFDCQVKILRTDCLFELKSTSTNFLKEYQEAVDCTTNEGVKSLAVNRYRFVKYGI